MLNAKAVHACSRLWDKHHGLYALRSVTALIESSLLWHCITKRITSACGVRVRSITGSSNVLCDCTAKVGVNQCYTLSLQTARYYLKVTARGTELRLLSRIWKMSKNRNYIASDLPSCSISLCSRPFAVGPGLESWHGAARRKH